MRQLKILAIILFLALPTLAYADVDNIPGTATWYFHADFDAMRKGGASKELYDWVDGEVFQEIRNEIGIDFDKEARQLTAFSANEDGPVIVLDGKISQETKDKVLAIAAIDGELETFKASGKAYYFFDGESVDENESDSDDADSDDSDDDNIDIDIDSLEDEAYVSVALKNKIVITNTRAQMEALLDNNGKIRSKGREKDALLVLRAERSLIQAGVNASEMRVDDDGDWDSNILKNTRQLAVLLSDLGDKLGIEAKLMTTQPEMADSMASIVRGLISLQAFNDDMDPDVASVLQSTKVDVADSTLQISLALDPDTVVSALEN